MTIQEIFIENLNYYFNQTGKSQYDFANYCDVKQPVVWAWLNGKKHPRIDKYDIICDFLGISIVDLFSTKKKIVDKKQTLLIHKYQKMSQADRNFLLGTIRLLEKRNEQTETESEIQ